MSRGAEKDAPRYNTPTGEHPTVIKMREDIARCVEQGYTEGDVNHYTQPIIGMLRLRLRDGKALTDDEMKYAVERLSRACDAETAWLNTPIPPARSLLDVARDRGIEPVGTDLDIETGKRAAPECSACGVELSEDGACWWCDAGPEPTAVIPPAKGDAQ